MKSKKIIKESQVDLTSDSIKIDGEGYESNRHISITDIFLDDISRGSYLTIDLMYYASLKFIANNSTLAVVTLDMLLSYTKTRLTKAHRDSARESLTRLVHGEKVALYDSMMCDNPISIQDVGLNDIIFVSLAEDFIAGETFVKIYDTEMQGMIEIGNGRSTANLLWMFAKIATNIWYNGKKECRISNVSLVKETGYNEKTVSKYVSMLEECHALFRVMVTFQDNDGYLKKKNIYTRYKWRSLLQKRYL